MDAVRLALEHRRPQDSIKSQVDYVDSSSKQSGFVIYRVSIHIRYFAILQM